MNRDECIKRIRKALLKRSGRPWSVKGGRGTAWGWITVDAPPARRTWAKRERFGPYIDPHSHWEWFDAGSEGQHTSPAELKELAALLGLDTLHNQGWNIPGSTDHYKEAIERAEGKTVTKIAQAYWD